MILPAMEKCEEDQGHKEEVGVGIIKDIEGSWGGRPVKDETRVVVVFTTSGNEGEDVEAGKDLERALERDELVLEVRRGKVIMDQSSPL